MLKPISIFVGFFQKNESSLGFEDFVDIFGGHHKIRLYLGFIYMHFRVFSYAQCTEWRKFFGCLISNSFLECLKFLIFFFGGGG